MLGNCSCVVSRCVVLWVLEVMAAAVCAVCVSLQSKVPCNWAPVTERAAKEPDTEGNSASASLSAQAEER